MDLGVSHYDLAPVGGIKDVWAGIVPYNGNDSKHEAVLYEALPRYLGPEFALHGKPYPVEHLSAVVEAANLKQIEIDFPVVAYKACGRIQIVNVGIMTGKSTFHAVCDNDNNLVIVPFWHAEDTSLDPALAKQFREYTRSFVNPKGIGLGTHLTQLKMLQLAKGNPEWIYGGRENEYDDGNLAIKGLMGKLKASLGTPQNSPVLQLDGHISHLERKGWIDVKTEILPDMAGHPDSLSTGWSSEDGKQQLAVIDTLICSTVDATRVAWTKIKSNGNVPEGDQLDEILEEMLATSREKMTDLEWGAPRRKVDCPIIPVTGSPQEIEEAVRTAKEQGILQQAIEGGWYSHKFGNAVPVRRIHINKEGEIAKALQGQKIKAVPRTFGLKPMLSGVTPNPEELFSQTLPEATKVNSTDPSTGANKPYFDLAPQSNEALAHTLFADGQKNWVEPSRGYNDNRPRSNLLSPAA